MAFAEKVLAERRPLRKIRDLDDKTGAVRGKPEVFAEFRKSVARQTRGFRAPESCIKAVEAAVNLPFDQGLARERELFQELLNSPESKAQRYFFFAEREAAKIPDVPADTPSLPIRKAAVIGAGTMGGGIAMNFANAGIPVTVVEVAREALDRGLGIVRKNYEATASRGRLTKDDVEKRMGLITGTTDFGAVADADMIVEAVFEEMPIKKEVFARLDGLAKAGAVLATNTSTLDVDEIASATKRPESVIGTHFFSPANVMRLLEVVRGAKSSKPVIATAMAVGKQIAKVPVLVGVCDGFVGNRMLHQRAREAEKLILEGALPQQVDKVLYDFGFPMGPFAMSDMAGLDVGWRIRKGKGDEVGGGRPPVRDGALRPEDGGRLLPLRGQRPHAEAGHRGGEDHHRGLGRDGHHAPVHPRRRDPRPAPLPHGQRGGQDPRGEAGHPGQRHRRDLGLRLRLARVSRRPHVLGRLPRAQGGARSHARVPAPARRRLEARGPARPPGQRGQGLYGLNMGGPMSTLTVESPQDLKQHVGKELGPSDWFTVDQAMIDKFAEATGDHQWIHVDVERAKREMPGGKTIAHGYLTLSLVPRLASTLVKVTKRKRGVNYGSNKVRFTNMVPAGARVRLRQKLVKVEDVAGGGVRITSEMTMEIEGQEKPALVAETMGVQYA